MNIPGEYTYPLNMYRVLRDIFGQRSLFYLSDNNVWIPEKQNSFNKDLIANYDYVYDENLDICFDSLQLLKWFAKKNPKKYGKLIKQYRQAISSYNLFFKSKKYKNDVIYYSNQHEFALKYIKDRTEKKDWLRIKGTTARSLEEIEYYKISGNYFVNIDIDDDLYHTNDLYEELGEELQSRYNFGLHLTNLIARLFGNEFLKPQLLSLQYIDLEKCMFHNASIGSVKILYTNQGEWPLGFRCFGCSETTHKIS